MPEELQWCDTHRRGFLGASLFAATQVGGAAWAETRLCDGWS